MQISNNNSIIIIDEGKKNYQLIWINITKNMCKSKSNWNDTNESGFSLTLQQSTRHTVGYSKYDQLNEATDLLEHLNVDQHGNK